MLASPVAERRLPPVLQPVAEAMAEAVGAEARCSGANEVVRVALSKGALETGGAEGLTRAQAALDSYATALQGHIAARARAMTLLQKVLDDQVRGKG